VRQIGAKGSSSDAFDGTGIINRLNKLQHPGVHHQQDKLRFSELVNFVRQILEDQRVEIEIPHELDTIHVLIDNKVLPIESLGTGIHEVIIGAAATVLNNTVVCIEEPELHLNPILQKKLIRYLFEKTTNQYFISTHSPALMDAPGAEIYHVRMNAGSSLVERVTSNKQRSAVCEDLGYHPSDLLQANCVIWVEGPSDRIYLKHWVTQTAPHLIEGVHFSLMFYAGRLSSHLSYEDTDSLLADFISLRKLNRRGCIVIDSDRQKKGGKAKLDQAQTRKAVQFGPRTCLDY
jgi:hypothetical protein